MTTYYLNGTALQQDADFTLNGMTYPYSWLEGTSPEVRASLGIEKIGDINFNTKYYWSEGNPKILEDRAEVDEEGNPLYVQIHTEIDGYASTTNSDVQLVTKGLKTTCTQEVKSTANGLLKPTDYYIIRNAVEELQIPTSVSTYRAAVVAEQDRLTTAIASVTSVEELIEVMSSIAWPVAE